MLFPNDMTPFDANARVVTIEYTEAGYLSHDDVDEINYDDLLVKMQDNTKAQSKARKVHKSVRGNVT